VIEKNFNLLERAHDPVEVKEKDDEEALDEAEQDYVSPLRAASPTSPTVGESKRLPSRHLESSSSDEGLSGRIKTGGSPTGDATETDAADHFRKSRPATQDSGLVTIDVDRTHGHDTASSTAGIVLQWLVEYF